ncbi:MAG: YbgA family protein [Thermodesulfovibrionales bacterium]
MMEKIKIGISSCLLGEKVRYDGNHKKDQYITDTLGHYFEWVSICPEVEYGLPVPREPMHLIGNPTSPRLVTIHTGIDHTEGMLKWAEKRLKDLEKEEICGFIFKSKSPSSGIGGVKVYTPSGMPSKKGIGIFGGAFMKKFPLIPVIDEGRLHDPILRENFIERVFVYKRWKEFMQKGGSVKDLVDFHTKHKLLILSHSPKHLNLLGQLIANSKKYKPIELRSEYINFLMEGLQLNATVKKNTNVLFHLAGYFKKYLSSDDKKELLEVIEDYHKGYVPLIVPIILIKHYIRKFNEPYLKRQYYLNPHPIELMLRNHA